MQTFVKMSRDAIIGKDDEISLYKLLESVKEIRNKDISIALVEHAFDALKVVVEKLSNNSNNNNDTYDNIYSELKSNADKYGVSIMRTNIFTSIESNINKLEENAKEQLATLSNTMKDIFDNQNNPLANFTTSSSSSLQIANSMESIVGGKENMTKIKSSVSTVYESTKFFLSGGGNTTQNAKESWRVREQALWYSLQFIQSKVVVNAPNNNIKETNIAEDFVRVKDEVENLLVVRKAIESNGAVQQLLVHPETTNVVNEALSAKWEGQQDRIKREMDEQKKELDLLIKEYEKAEKEEPGGTKALALKRQYDDGKAKLKQCLTNCTNIGSQLGIVLDFLDGIQNQLFKMDAKLDQIQDTLNDMQHDLKLLVGRTFDEAVQYHIKWEKKQREKLRNEVYVPIKCWKRGDWDEDGSFHIKSDKVLGKDTYDLMEEVWTFLKKDSGMSALLIHGLAGKLLWEDYERNHSKVVISDKPASNDKDETICYLPLLCTLPALEHPLTDLVNDALKQIFGREGKKELSEFRNQVENGTIIPLFVLDGYDELKQEHLGSNLYETNDLQDYVVDMMDKIIEDKLEETEKADMDSKRGEKDKGAGEEKDNREIKKNNNFPKVIYLCRTEFLATKPNAYREWFRPGTDIKADGMLTERLIASFDITQRNEYFAARVTRNFSELICDRLDVDKMDFVLSEHGDLGLRNTKEIDNTNNNDDDDDGNTIQLQNILSYIKCPKKIYMSEILHVAITFQNKLRNISKSNNNTHDDKRAFVFSTLVATLNINKKQYSANDIETCWKQIQDLATKDHSKVWPVSEFQEAFERMRELEDLTKTPFMLKICTDVIDLLRAMGATPARIKERTIIASKMRHRFESQLTKAFSSKNKDKTTNRISLKRKLSNAIHSNKFKELSIKETADNTWKMIKQNRMLDQLKEIQEWIDMYTEKKSDDVDTKVDIQIINLLKRNNSLLKILKRSPVDRYRIYKTFIRYYINAEAKRKQTKAISVIELINEAYEFSTQLALEMTEENLTKVRYEQGQHRFREETRWKRFLGGNDEAMEMIRRVAPIQKGT
eukprot:g6156.t1